MPNISQRGTPRYRLEKRFLRAGFNVVDVLTDRVMRVLNPGEAQAWRQRHGY